MAVGAFWIMHRIFCIFLFPLRYTAILPFDFEIYAQIFYALIQFLLYCARLNLGSDSNGEGQGVASVWG